MSRFIIATVVACFIGQGSPAYAQSGGNLVIGGIPQYETSENYLRFIKHLTVGPSKQTESTFHGTDVQAIRSLEDPLRRQIFQAMAYSGSERFSFASTRKAQENFTMRIAAIRFMYLMARGPKNGGIDFHYYRPGRLAAEADPNHWRKVRTFEFVSLPGARAADAIYGITRTRFRGECLGAIEIAILQAARRAVGPDRFNAMHPSGLQVGNPKGKTLARHVRNGRRVSVGEMVPGDWVYMKNQNDYNTGLRSGAIPGPWQGENSIYIGRCEVGTNGTLLFRNNAPPRFSGMGAYNLDEAGLRRVLKKGYLELMRPPNTTHVYSISESNIRFTAVRRLVTGSPEWQRQSWSSMSRI